MNSMLRQRLSQFAALCNASSKRFYNESSAPPLKVTLPWLRKKYQTHHPLVAVTAYDHPTGVIVDRAGVDIVLVGDSLGMVVLGHNSTVPVTLDEMVHHCKAVSRGCRRPLIVGDLPFGSTITPEETVRSAVRLLKEGGVDAVKVEGGRPMFAHIKALRDMNIAVMGHIGLTPQTATSFGGFLAQGKRSEQALRIYEDAKLLEKLGCFSLVIECVPEKVSQIITESVSIPTIGIGAGKYTSGQIQVFHDLCGLSKDLRPKFSKTYVEGAHVLQQAIEQYCVDTREKAFPQLQHTFKISEKEYEKFERYCEQKNAETNPETDPDVQVENKA